MNIQDKRKFILGMSAYQRRVVGQCIWFPMLILASTLGAFVWVIAKIIH